MGVGGRFDPMRFYINNNARMLKAEVKELSRKKEKKLLACIDIPGKKRAYDFDLWLGLIRSIDTFRYRLSFHIYFFCPRLAHDERMVFFLFFFFNPFPLQV